MKVSALAIAGICVGHRRYLRRRMQVSAFFRGVFSYWLWKSRNDLSVIYLQRNWVLTKGPGIFMMLVGTTEGDDPSSAGADCRHDVNWWMMTDYWFIKIKSSGSRTGMEDIWKSFVFRVTIRVALAKLGDIWCVDIHIITYTRARGLFGSFRGMVVEVLLGMGGVGQYLVVTAVDGDVDCGFFFCHVYRIFGVVRPGFLWTYVQRFSGRTSWDAMHVRPKLLWTYVQGRPERGWTGVNKKGHMTMVSEQFLNGIE